MPTRSTTLKTEPAPGQVGPALDMLSLSRKEGFKRMVEAPRRQRPTALTRAQLAGLTDAERTAEARARRVWHANLGPIRTPQLVALHEDLQDIYDSNAHDGHLVKGAMAIDAFPGLGKTTAALAFARKVHRAEIAEAGEFTADGHERIPVCRIGLAGTTGMKDLNRAILEFYGHLGRYSGTAAQFGHRALDCVLSCQTRLLVVDEVHFLRNSSATEVSNHFKHIANEFPVTLLLIGVGLAARGLFDEGTSYADGALAQTGRRTTRLGMEPFKVDTEQGRQAWRTLLLAIEERLVLAGKYPGMVAEDLADYLFARSTGHIGSLMTLINRGCQRAVRTGAEALSTELLDHVKNDEAAERARIELEAALSAGAIRARASRPRRQADGGTA